MEFWFISHSFLYHYSVICVMEPTYTQMLMHTVFAVKNESAMIEDSWRDRLHNYLTAVIQNRGNKMLAINSLPDHLHFLFGWSGDESLSDIMRHLKRNSSKWINDNGLTSSLFRWQEGYGMVSHSRSELDRLVKYIKNQQNYHETTAFIPEYKQFLTDAGIEFDERYIFHPPL